MIWRLAHDGMKGEREREKGEGGEPVQYAAVGRSIRTSIEPQIFAKRYCREKTER